MPPETGLASAIELSLHQAREVGGDSADWWIQNARHGLNVRFTPAETVLSVKPHLDPALRYATRWRTTEIGVGEAGEAVPAGDVRAQGNRVEIRRPGLVEWFVNRATGLEHGYVVTKAPDSGNGGGGELWVRLALAGDLRAVTAEEGTALSLRNGQGEEVLAYSRLKVWDAKGRDLPARLEADGDAVTLRVDARDAVYPVTIDPTFQQEAYLKSSTPGSFDEFGWTVDISGDTAVVGAPFEDGSATGVNGLHDDNALEAGAAYVFVRSGTTWTQQAYLKASNAGAGDEFGTWVGIDGDTVIVGANLEDGSATTIDGANDDNAIDSGAAYVFFRTGSSWAQQAYLKPSNTGAGDEFGFSVDVKGDLAIVGARNEDGSATTVNGASNDSATDAGAAYVFLRTGATWAQQAYLKAANSGAGDLFGSSVVIDGSLAVVGAHEEDGSSAGIDGANNNSALDAGAAYVFLFNTGTWSQNAYLKASNPDPDDAFGRAVGISGDTVIIGASLEDGGTSGVDGADNDSLTDSGAAYIFFRNVSVWSQQAYVKSFNPGSADSFGRSVAIDGDAAVVGSYREDGSSAGTNGSFNEGSTNSGAAYVYIRNGSTWSTKDYLKASNPGAEDNFGRSVSVDGGTVVVGSFAEDGSSPTINGPVNDNLLEAGAAYVYELGATPATITMAAPRPFKPTKVGRKSRPQTFLITNQGEVSLTGLGVALAGPGRRDFKVTQPSATVAAAGTTTFKLTFKPRKTGQRKAVLGVSANEATKIFPVKGKGK